jgi:hypothetical protein
LLLTQPRKARLQQLDLGSLTQFISGPAEEPNSNELRRGPARPHPFTTEKPFRSPGSDTRDGPPYIDRRF